MISVWVCVGMWVSLCSLIIFSAFLHFTSSYSCCPSSAHINWIWKCHSYLPVDMADSLIPRGTHQLFRFFYQQLATPLWPLFVSSFPMAAELTMLYTVYISGATRRQSSSNHPNFSCKHHDNCFVCNTSVQWWETCKPLHWGVQSECGVCLFTEALIWTICSKWVLWYFSCSFPLGLSVAFVLCAHAALCWHPCWFRGRMESVLMAL